MQVALESFELELSRKVRSQPSKTLRDYLALGKSLGLPRFFLVDESMMQRNVTVVTPSNPSDALRNSRKK